MTQIFQQKNRLNSFKICVPHIYHCLYCDEMAVSIHFQWDPRMVYLNSCQRIWRWLWPQISPCCSCQSRVSVIWHQRNTTNYKTQDRTMGPVMFITHPPLPYAAGLRCSTSFGVNAPYTREVAEAFPVQGRVARSWQGRHWDGVYTLTLTPMAN